ncbi:MAG: group II intron reverse transcriptase/maturase [Candidatus Omnitrophota bacterium]|nr:group II intron reverse transcriptase/maturase [Candidatus Omnitrophota bacterium]
METKLDSLSQYAAKEPQRKFVNIMYQVNESSLKANFYLLGRKRAVGVDGVGWQEYGEGLDANIDNLLERMKRMGYRPQPVRRVYIPKGRNDKRPLGIPTVEDKVAQKTMSRIMEAVYEQDFYEFSYGFRPGKSCHQALKRVGEIINFKPINHIIEADIKGFFDNVGHEKLMELVRRRITDKKFLRYIVRFLKAGYIESGLLKEAKQGTPQGGNLSPLLANIFLHYVLDEWFEKELKPTLVGQCYLVRYCDDFVILTQYQQEAKTVMTRLQERFEAYGLELNTEKSGVISFGRYERENAEKQLRRANTFDFLGFTHYCALTRKGKFKVSRRTSAERFRKSLREIYLWLKAFKNTISIKELWTQLVSKLRGHYQYYGVSENLRRLQEFYHHIEDMAFKLLNRRCDKKSFNWRGFCKYLQRFPLPKPHIVCNFYA